MQLSQTMASLIEMSISVRIMQDKLILEIRIYTISICCTGLLALK
jgi:hypothetical protein